MVLKVAATALTAILPAKYYIHAILALVTVLVVRAFAHGRSTNRERDLHGRVILVTGGFTPLGLTLLHHLALRGAHIIALSPLPIDSPKITILVTLLRSTTNNEHIYADECDLRSVRSVKGFCAKFLSVGAGTGMGMGMGREQRLDAIVFGHEYSHVGWFFSPRRGEKKVKVRAREETERKEASLGTFLMTTLLLPALLVAPVERDIRIINIINPFYAAAAPTFSPSDSFSSPSSSSSSSKFLLPEGTRALRTAIFTRHLQRILDALPSAGQVPKTDTASAPSTGGGAGAIPVISPKTQKSNIVAVSVCPGISRSDTVAPMLGADRSVEEGEKSVFGTVLYYLLQPLLRLLVKSPTAALQSVLHVLFLPTPFKAAPKSKRGPDVNKSSSTGDEEGDALPEEILKPGALYRECAVVKLWVPRGVDPLEDVVPAASSSSSNKGKGKEKEKEKTHDDDGELGGEVTGRLVWESFETALKEWEDANPDPDLDTTTGKSGDGSGGRGGTPPEVDRDVDAQVET